MSVVFCAFFVVSTAGFLAYTLNVNRLLTGMQTAQAQQYAVINLLTQVKDRQASFGAYAQSGTPYAYNQVVRENKTVNAAVASLAPRAKSADRALHADITSLNAAFEALLDDVVAARRQGGAVDRAQISGAQTLSDKLLASLDAYLKLLMAEDARNDQILSARNNQLRALYIAGLVLAIAVCLLVALAISDAIAQPLRRLAQASRSISAGKWSDKPLPVGKADEVGMVTSAFNKMQTDIKAYIDQLQASGQAQRLLHEEELKNLRMQELLREAQLLALQSQINPHFLFNTLNSISRSVTRDEPAVTQRLISSLAQLFRYNIDHFGVMSTLQKEVEAVERYICLQQYRFSDRIAFTVEVDAACRDALLPSMTLQPLVENAVIHGMEGVERDGRITIHAHLLENFLLVDVIDNGCGIPQSVRENLYARETHTGHTTGIGLANIMRRISLMDGGSLTVLCPAVGAHIRITLPYRREVNDP